MNSDNPSTKKTDYPITEEVDVDFFMEYIEHNPISSTAPIAPVAPTHPSSIAQDGFRYNDPSVFDYGQYWISSPSESFVDNSDCSPYQGNMYPSSESVHGQSAPDWNHQGGHNHWNAGHQHHSKTNVAFGAPNISSQMSAHPATGINSFYNDEFTQAMSNQTPDPVRALSSGCLPYEKRPTSVAPTPSMGHLPPWSNVTSPRPFTDRELSKHQYFVRQRQFIPHLWTEYQGLLAEQSATKHKSSNMYQSYNMHHGRFKYQDCNMHQGYDIYHSRKMYQDRNAHQSRAVYQDRERTPAINHQTGVKHHTAARDDASAPHQSENEDSGDGGQAAVDADAASAAHKHILAIEKQARVAIKKFQNKISISGQMGESITLTRTNTGVVFGGTMWMAPANDGTIPTSDKEIKARVDALERAMCNTTNVREKTGTGASKNRWSLNSDYYTPEEFNAAAGLLVKELINIHTKGWTKQIFDKNERDQCQVTMFYTFEDRFEGLRELLEKSKTSVQDIMKGSRFFTIIANPRLLINRTATNRTANVNKAGQIQAGKEVMKNGSSAEAFKSEKKNKGEENQDNEERSNSEETPKVKKVSKGKKRAHEETFVAEDPAGQPPRKKAAAKKRRSA
ncbi:hypothetical protein BKA58DRAFT_435097 [Alternaria rosae]|uniref:uncharacterized protein n=1 Tax=Alternaria rosae TaxID=1187941 RepID=UPI001E8D7A83|nr:uncharacterized protein BKA58DRAFT_435097 [Alternaria rosae]KAH6883353.1 hypothetical protein BKA58DRAFT_435097 [Alternaria rosae]